LNVVVQHNQQFDEKCIRELKNIKNIERKKGEQKRIKVKKKKLCLVLFSTFQQHKMRKPKSI
jgi:hypothetical protein